MVVDVHVETAITVVSGLYFCSSAVADAVVMDSVLMMEDAVVIQDAAILSGSLSFSHAAAAVTSNQLHPQVRHTYVQYVWICKTGVRCFHLLRFFQQSIMSA